MRPAVDPCGHVCDLIRSPYEAPFRFFADSQEVTKVHWYVVPRDRPALPVASIFQHEPWNFDGPPRSNMHQGQPPFFQGEQYTDRYGGGRKEPVPPVEFTGHFCGSAEQWQGQLSRLRSEDIGKDGCCSPHLPREDSEGGIGVTGLCRFDFVPGKLGSGGVAESGYADALTAYAVRSTGGTLQGGYSLRQLPYLDSRGGVLEDGHGLVGLVQSRGSSGGVLVLGGSVLAAQQTLVSVGGVAQGGMSATGSLAGLASYGGVAEAGSSAQAPQMGIASVGGTAERGTGAVAAQLGIASRGGPWERGHHSLAVRLGIRAVGGIGQKGVANVSFNGIIVPPLPDTIPGGAGKDWIRSDLHP